VATRPRVAGGKQVELIGHVDLVNFERVRITDLHDGRPSFLGAMGHRGKRWLALGHVEDCGGIRWAYVSLEGCIAYWLSGASGAALCVTAAQCATAH